MKRDVGHCIDLPPDHQTAKEARYPVIYNLHAFEQAALLDAGVNHTYMEIEGLANKQKEMLARYREIYFDYPVESLRPVHASKR